MKQETDPATPSQPVFLPKLVSALKSYSMSLFWGDLTAGIIVAIVALPLAIAFAIASGLTPDRGLVASIVGGLIISVFGGSRVQIGGTTGAFAVIIYRVVGDFGIEGLLVCTFLAGVLLILMGAFRLGNIIKFIPYPLTLGFTSGVAVLIAVSQVRDLLGLQTGPLPVDVIEKLQAYAHGLGTFQPLTCLLSAVSVAVIAVWPRISRKIPGFLVVLVGMTGLVAFFELPVATIGSSFDSLFSHRSGLSLGFEDVKTLLRPAFTIAFLGAIQSLLSASVADGLIEGRHRPNAELIAQGMANLCVPFFGGLPATGAVARTLTNVKSGGKTPVAGVVHSLVLLAIVLLFGRWIPRIPLFVLAAILMVVTYNMAEWRAIRALLKAPKTDLAVMIITFLLTVFVDLTVGVEVGIFLSFALFAKRMTDVTTIREITAEMGAGPPTEEELRGDAESVSRRQVPEGVSVFEAEGVLFFGAVELLRDALNLGRSAPKVLIFRMRHLLALDATGLRALKDLKSQCDRGGTRLILSGVHAQPMFALEKSGFLSDMTPENITATLDEALERSKRFL